MSQDKQKKPLLKSAAELKGEQSTRDKKPFPKWALLLILLVLISGAWGAVNMTDVFKAPQQPEATAVPSTRVTLIDKQQSDFKQLTITQSGSPSYTIKSEIEYDDDGNAAKKAEGVPSYVIDGMPQFTLSESLAASIHTNAVSQTATATVEQESLDLGIFGLTDPALTASISFKDGTQTTMYFGDKVPTGTGYYVMMDDKKTVYTIPTASFNAFNRSMNSLHSTTLPVQMDPEGMADLVIEQAGKPTVELTTVGKASATSIATMWLKQPIHYDAHQTRGAELVAEVSTLTLGGYAGTASAPEELELYGLANPAAKIRYVNKDGSELQIHIGNAQDELFSYVTVDQSGDVYLMETALLSFMSGVTAERLVDQFAGLININAVDSLTVSSGAEQFVLSIVRKPIENEDGTTSSEDTYYMDGAERDERGFKALYQEIIGLLFDKFNDRQAPITGDPVVTIRFKLNDGQPDIVIDYLVYDEDYYLIRQGETELFVIKRQKVDAMLEKCREYKSLV